MALPLEFAAPILTPGISLTSAGSVAALCPLSSLGWPASLLASALQCLFLAGACQCPLLASALQCLLLASALLCRLLLVVASHVRPWELVPFSSPSSTLVPSSSPSVSAGPVQLTFINESTPEPAPFQKLTESTPEPAAFQELTESTPEPAPFQDLTESTPEPAPVQELTEFTPEPAPVQELTEFTPEPAPVQELTESTPEPAPVQELTESTPERPQEVVDFPKNLIFWGGYPPWPTEAPDPPWLPKSPDLPWPLRSLLHHWSRNGHRPGGHLHCLHVPWGLQRALWETLFPCVLCFRAHIWDFLLLFS